jgi:hypothetical protein
MRALHPRFWIVGCLLAFGVLGRADAAEVEPDLETERAELVRELDHVKQRVKLLEERLRQLDSRRAKGSRAAPLDDMNVSAACARPFFLDSSGIKHVRPDCAAAAAVVNCEAPFTLDSNGIKRLRPECGG